VRMRLILKLRGNDATGNRFEELTATENVSAGGFLCNSTTTLAKGSHVDVYLCGETERFVGRARMVRKESSITAWQRYGFQFEERNSEWVLQA